MSTTYTVRLTEEQYHHMLGHTEGDYCEVCKGVHHRLRLAHAETDLRPSESCGPEKGPSPVDSSVDGSKEGAD
jgi:hypothetical protein